MMSKNHDGVVELLNDIKTELEKQLTTAKKDTEISMGNLFQLAELMPNRLLGCDLNAETKESLLKFSNTFYGQATTLENLKMQLDDVKKILTTL